jgi:hypothetical protein
MTLAPNPFTELWHYGTKRCLMTPAGGNPPFSVALYDGDTLLSRFAFDSYEQAIAFAVEALRIAKQP